MSRFKFFEDESGIDSQSAFTNEDTILESPSLSKDIQSKKYRYRVEQITLSRFNGQIVSHGTTKQEYLIIKNTANGITDSLEVQLIENVIQFEPPQLQTAISLLCNVDIVKCNVVIDPDSGSGKMNRIRDKSNLLIAWEQYKKDITKNFSFLTSKEEWDNINIFVELVEGQINDDHLLIADYESKIFFDLIFDRYLVLKEDFSSFTKFYISNLFDHKLLLLDIEQAVIQRSSESVRVKQVGTLNKKDINQDEFAQIYNDKFKPYVGFSFTEYDYKFMNDYTLNTAENILEKANVVIIEEIKNNVQITVNYELQLVEL